MRILLIGELYSANLGDQLIYESTKKVITSIYSDVVFEELDIMNRKQTLISSVPNRFYKFIYRIKKILLKNSMIEWWHRKREVNNLKAFYEKKISKDFDCAIFTGGALLQDVFALNIKTIVELLNQQKIPIYFNAIGTGILTGLYKRILIATLEENIVYGISCRCKKERIQCLLSEDKIVKPTFDTAIFANTMIDLRKKDSKCIGLGVMKSSRFSENILIEFWIAIIKECEKQGIDWRMFTTGQEDDQALAKKILDKCSLVYKINEKLYDRPTTSEQLIKIISNFGAIISFRLHSHIISYSLGIPSVAISWDTKIDDFFEILQLSKNVFRIDDISVAELVTYVVEIMKNKCLSPILVRDAQNRAKGVLEDMLSEIFI